MHLLTDKVVYIILTVNDLQRLLSKIFFHGSFFFFFSPKFLQHFWNDFSEFRNFFGILRGTGDEEAEYKESVIPMS